MAVGRSGCRCRSEEGHERPSRPAPCRRVRTALATASSAAAEPARVGFPSSIASTGDSITRAYNTCSFPYIDCVFELVVDRLEHNGERHYRRILAGNGGHLGAHLQRRRDRCGHGRPGRAGATRRHAGAQYVTVMLGANDACASSEAAMTPTATFRAQFAQGLQTLGGPPDRVDLRRQRPGPTPALEAVEGQLHCADRVGSRRSASRCSRTRGSSSATDTARRERVRQRDRVQRAAARGMYAVRSLPLRRRRRVRDRVRPH